MTSSQYVGSLRIATVLCLLLLPDQLVGAEGDYNVVDRSEVLEAMRQHYGGYETNIDDQRRVVGRGGAFSCAASWGARSRRPARCLLGTRSGFRSFLAVTGHTEDTAPEYALLNYRYEQNMEVDYRLDRVIREVVEGPMPELAVNVRISWEDGPGKPDRYSYIDTLSTPIVRVTNRQVITYRLLDFGDWIVYDEIEGITARPESGVLALLFRLIGEGHMTHSRIAVAKDGIHVSRTRAEKAFMKVMTTVTIYPNGIIEQGVAGWSSRSAGTRASA